MKIFKFFLVVLMSTILFSCEGNTDRYYHIKNESSDSVRLIAEGSWYQSVIDTMIPPNTFLAFYSSSSRGGSSYLDYDPGYAFLRFEITNKNLDTCRQDYRDNYSWYSGATEMSKNPSNYRHDYVFTVKDEHFK
jgi:hypothetical protein